MPINDNMKKYLSGRTIKQLLKKTINDLYINPNINIDYEMDYKTGYKEYDVNQFKMDAKIEFKDSDNEIWLIKTTSSIRTDRVKGNQFDAQNIRKLLPNLTKIYLVTSETDSKKENDQRKRYSSQIKQRKIYSEIDDVITFNTLSLLIREKAVENLSQGKRANVLGTETEYRIDKALKNDANIEIWNDVGDRSYIIKSGDFEIFKEILLTFGLKRTEIIKEIKSTIDIPRLPGGGSAKTDIYCEIITDESEYSIGISVKESAAKMVTIHEGYVQNLLEVLGIDMTSEIGIALLKLQEQGGPKKLLEYYPESYNILDEQLKYYNEDLIKYFYFGIGSGQDDIQIANLIVYNKVFKASTVEQLINELKDVHIQFNTPFSFTYPSGGRGKKIQVKGITNN